MSEYDFQKCPRCHGYGVRDDGENCPNCGGKGSGGLRTQDGVIGSGEVIIERSTGRQIPHAEFARRTALGPAPSAPGSGHHLRNPDQ
jgi:RecJ-like exonuclease